MPKSLSPSELYKCCEPELFKFKTTAELTPLEGTIGQERAMRALEFSLGLDAKGYNVYILGESGTGKMASLRAKLKEISASKPTPPDWVYVYNFKDSDRPYAISMKPGAAKGFQKDMDEFVNILRVEIPKAFESKEYEKHRNKVLEEFQKSQKESFNALDEESKEHGFSVRKTVSGLLIVPIKKDGEPLSEEEFEKLEPDVKARIEKMGKSYQERLDDLVRSAREAEKKVKEQLQKLERDAAMAEAGHLIEEMKSKYSKYKKITGYLDAVMEDVLKNVHDFKTQEAESQPPIPFLKMPRQEPSFVKYKVNVLVDNSDVKGAPCVFESNPTYYNIFGRIEHNVQYGLATTDFSMIKAGSMHQANGGYLVINALDLLRNMFSYDSLKRSIRNREIRMEDIWEQYRLITTATLKPEAVPLEIKVVLVGPPEIYYLLYAYDEEYREMFKVKADFDTVMDRTSENTMLYARFVAERCKTEGLLPFDASGMSKVVEYGSRLAEHQMKLSSKFSFIADLLREANHFASLEGKKIVTSEHIEKALDEKRYRKNRIETRLREMTIEDTFIIKTSGEVEGQVNGLAVLSMGDYSFGKPSRITARTFTGTAGVLNLERETKMSGRIHEKAVLILSNYLGSKYALKKPISLSATIGFEQLYEMIEGDSATCAELYALLSSIAGVPMKQSIAITGSMDQQGDVQPIGGVNEKIEGFFDLCKERGLDGKHGVIIPSRNVKHLMLKKEVVEAVKSKKFQIYPISRVEEGLEILSGMKAGEQDKRGHYPKKSINGLVMKRLDEIREALKKKSEPHKKADKKSGPRKKAGKKASARRKPRSGR